MQRFFFLLHCLFLFGCKTENKHISNSICASDSLISKEISVSNQVLERFNDNMVLSESGHYITGVFATESDTIIMSAYVGPKTDSIISSVGKTEATKKRLGNNHYWFQSKGNIYVFSDNELVCISTSSIEDKTELSVDKLYTLVKLCD